MAVLLFCLFVVASSLPQVYFSFDADSAFIQNFEFLTALRDAYHSPYYSDFVASAQSRHMSREEEDALFQEHLQAFLQVDSDAVANDEELAKFRLLEDRTDLAAQAKNQHKAKAKQKAQAKEALGNFPEQPWTYKDIKSPPDWLVPSSHLPPGLPITKPPPVPQMIPPPPPFPASLDNHGPYSGAGSEAPPPPSYTSPNPPPAILPRWVPWTAYFTPDAHK